jgi:predicted aspartyl protease
METQTADKIIVTAKVENLEDLYMVEEGILPAEQVRFVEVPDALVDKGATMLSMPTRLIAQFGLRPHRKRKSRSCAGPVTIQIYGAVRLTIQGRDCVSEVMELSDDCPILIGRIVLGMLDFVADPVNHRLIGNPAHGGEHILEMY